MKNVPDTVRYGEGAGLPSGYKICNDFLTNVTQLFTYVVTDHRRQNFVGFRGAQDYNSHRGLDLDNGGLAQCVSGT